MNEELNFDWIPWLESKSEEPQRILFTNYVRKDLLRRHNGLLYGNWSPSFTGACSSRWTYTIAENSVIRMQRVGNCSNNGPEIWMCEHH